MSVGTRIGVLARAGISMLPTPLLRIIAWCQWRILVAPTLPPVNPPRRVVTPRFLIAALLFVLAMMVWRSLRTYPSGVFDFYPLYFGGRAWRATGNAYDLAQVIPPDARDFQLFQIGNVYPFTAVLVSLPFSFLPPQVAAVVWVGFLSLGLIFALRLLGWPFWYLLYLPVVEGLRIEQYTIFVTIAQLFGLWAWRERRPWLVAVCCTLMMTKPNHTLFFVLALLLLTRAWRQSLIVALPFVAFSLLLQPNWIGEWIARLQYSHDVLQQPFYWQLAAFAIPLLLIGDLIGAAVALQFLMLPFPGSYAASALPFGVLGDRRSRWPVLIGLSWMIVAPFLGAAWATALTLLLPTTLLSLLRWWESEATRGRTTEDEDRMALFPAWLTSRVGFH